jgi:hypothetical protein
MESSCSIHCATAPDELQHPLLYEEVDNRKDIFQFQMARILPDDDWHIGIRHRIDDRQNNRVYIQQY